MGVYMKNRCPCPSCVYGLFCRSELIAYCPCPLENRHLYICKYRLVRILMVCNYFRDVLFVDQKSLLCLGNHLDKVFVGVHLS